LVIFSSRVVDVSLGTVRVNMIIRGQRWIAAVIGFFEVLIYILIVGKVVADIDQLVNVVAYALGFAAGTFVGIVINERISKRKLMATIISPTCCGELEQAFREAGFGVTAIPARGREGDVTLLMVVLQSHRKQELEDIISKIDEKAFTVYQLSDAVIGGVLFSRQTKM
jgi:uncharacterized protein YebE (UPF0316 family)